MHARRSLLVLLLSAAVPAPSLDRVPNTSLNLPPALPGGTFTAPDAFPGMIFADPVAIVTPPGESNRLFVVEQIGRIAVIPDLANPAKEIFLDIRDRVSATDNEGGLLGLAFHPNYNAAGETGYGEFFVFYLTTAPGQRHWRLARFSVDDSDPDRGDALSEIPLITQRDQAGNHNGGDLHFGEDGYLYVSVGDEGGANDSWDNGQHIDKDYFAAILRLDVDRLPSNLLPNSHAASHAGTYRVPADNPFVGATTFNGSAVNSANVRTEIWAIGLRNPWRMSFDRPTGRLFVADVGQGAREEIDILSPAVFAGNNGVPNYGWSFREGFADFDSGPGGATPPTGFTHIDPIHDYPRSLGQSVTGGLVYRGANYPELTGDYLFSDYVSGRIWAMHDPGGPSQSVTQIATEGQIAGFGLDPSTGDVLLAKDNSNRSEDDSLRRLVRTPTGGEQPPQFLSQTGAFSDLATLTPEAGIQAYEVNVPFWSDHAEKRRWFSIPDLGDEMTWARDENWLFPEGQVWIKHFDLELDRDNPGANRRRIETRFLVKTADDVYGITYRWNLEQTDAELVAGDGLEEEFTVTEEGLQRTQTWKYPSRSECRTCHNPAAGFALSFNTRQLNVEADLGDGPENVLAALADAGYFDATVPAPGTLPAFVPADDSNASLEERARSYLSVNCISCHQPGGPGLGNWNARPEIGLTASGIVGSPVLNNGGDPLARTIVPGDPDKSMILRRIVAVGNPGLPPMPPLATCEANQEAIALLRDWIDSLVESPPGFQPDLSIGRRPGALRGNNVYAPARQLFRIVQRKRRPIHGFFRAENDGEVDDAFRIAGSRGDSYFHIAYHVFSPARRNVTSDVSIGGYITEDLVPGASELSRITVKAKSSLRRSKRSKSIQAIVRAISVGQNSKQDRVSLKATSKK